MIELYFVFYWVPKKMAALARERKRSVVLWALAGIFSWIGAEFFVFICAGIVYGLGQAIWGWPQEEPGGVMALLYIAALGAAIGGFTIVRKILTSLPVVGEPAELPPPPPRFDQS
jgi:hypothetical protein